MSARTSRGIIFGGFGLLLLVAALPAPASATVGDVIRLQGRLLTSGGTPAPDGDYGLTVAFYAGKGDAKAVSKHPVPGVKVVGGAFALSVGGNVKLPLAKIYAGEIGWVGIKVGSDDELPRLALHKVPYAIVASRAQGLQCTGCVKAAQLDSAVLAPYAKTASLHEVAKTGSYKALVDKPKLALLGQSCPKGEFATGLQADGKLGCKVVVQNSYGGKDFALSGHKCGAGQVMAGVDGAGKPLCVADKDTKTVYKKGTGLTLSADTFALDTKYTDGRYVNEKQANAISSSMIANGQVTGADLAANAVTTDKIKAGGVTGSDLASDSVTTDKIKAGAVMGSDLAVNAVTTDKIKAGGVTASDIAGGAVTTSALKDGAVTAAKLGEPCKEGELLQRVGGKWQCRDVSVVANPGLNLVVNPTLRDSNKSGFPDNTWVDSDKANYKYVKLTDAEYHAALGGTGVNDQAGLYAVDLRSTGIKSKYEAMTIYKRLTPWTETDVVVTCSIYVRRPDKVGTNAKAKLECFGASTLLTIKNTDATWHRMKVTVRVRSSSKVSSSFMVYGSGARTGGDMAWVRYALPKVEYGRLATAWNAANAGVPKGMIAFFSGSYGCPPGWKEYTALRGRVVVGTNAGGKNGYTRGKALKAGGTRVITSVPAHTHSVNPPKTTSTNGGNHLHGIDPPSTTSSSVGNHSHYVDPPNTYTAYAGAHRHTAYAPNHDTNSSASQGYPAGNNHQSFRSSDRGRQRAISVYAISQSGNHRHTVNIGKFASASAGAHSHTTNIGKFNSLLAGTHNHTTDIPTFTSGKTGSSSVDVTMPYINLTACQAQ